MAEVYFHSPSLGAIWAAIEPPDAEVRANYPPDTVELPARPGAEHQWIDGAWVHVPPPPPDLDAARALMTLSRRRLLIGMADKEWITEDEAIAAAETGAMPPAVAAVIGALPPGQRTAARITWATMSLAFRLDPLVALLGAAQGVTPEEIDAFFADYSQI